MPIAWVIGATKEEHEEFVKEFKAAFAHTEDVQYIDEVVPMPDTEEETKLWRVARAEWKKKYKPDHQTILVSKWPNCFDDDGVCITEILDYIGSIIYILDDREEWEDCSLCMKRRPGQSIKDFVRELV